MNTGEVIAIVGASLSVIAVLLAVIGMGLVILQRIDAQRDRLEDKIEKVEASLGSRINEVEREQARQSGIASVLVQLARSPGDIERESV